MEIRAILSYRICDMYITDSAPQDSDTAYAGLFILDLFLAVGGMTFALTHFVSSSHNDVAIATLGIIVRIFEDLN